MGGQALGIQSSRIDKSDYIILFQFVKDVLPAILLIPSYEDKETFGDLDVIYPSSSGYTPEIIREALIKCGFKLYKEDNKNGKVYSLGIYWKGSVFQVDFIEEVDDKLGFAFNYYSWNDLGNLLGRVARNLNLKFGHAGLFYTQRSPFNDSIILKEHLLTSDFDEALRHLRYDPTRFRYGFKSLEDMFEFVKSSDFYDRAKFELHNRNAVARIRDRKRVNYNAFLKYTENDVSPTKNERISDYFRLNYHFMKFPEFKKEYDLCAAKDKVVHEYKAIYNGDLVRTRTGLDGKELGMFMQYLSPYLGKDSMDSVFALNEGNCLEDFIDMKFYIYKGENNE